MDKGRLRKPHLGWLRSVCGFTLIELLVVILIIGILIAVAAPSFLGQTQKAHDSASKQYLTVAYQEAKAAATDNTPQGDFVTPSFLASALAAAIQTSEPSLVVALASDSDPAHSCPAIAANQPDNHIFVDSTGTHGNSLELCADPSGNIWTLTVLNGGPPSFGLPISSTDAVTAAGVSAPASSSPPVLSDSDQAGGDVSTAQVGDHLVVSQGTWSNPPSSYSYSWQQSTGPGFSGSDTITPVGSNSSSYTLTAADLGDYLRATVQASNLGGAASAFSNATGSVVGVVTAIATGFSNTCALLSGGGVDCWGDNARGQLGDGTTINKHTPVSTGLSGAIAIAAGGYHSCAVLSGGGTVKCWGRNDYGQLGNGTTTDSSTPVVVTGLSGATAIAAGMLHTCALLSDHSVKCWGWNGEGGLGNGTTTGSSTAVSVTGISTATAIVTGYDYSCALLSDQSVKCWGYNNHGQLGNNSTTNSSLSVAASGISTATVLSAEFAQTCVRLSDNSVKCWGNNGYGGLGNNSTTDSSLPVAVSGISTATATATGAYHACAILSGSSSVDCWGYNSNGQLGNNSTTNSSVPVVVSGLSTATAIAGGYTDTCALLSNRTVKCWGDNSTGQLGDGTTTDRSTPVPVVGLP